MQSKLNPRGWSLRLRVCLSRLGQATEAKRLASRGLQGLAKQTQWRAWGLSATTAPQILNGGQPIPKLLGLDLDHSGSAVVALTRSSTKLVLQSCTLGCLSKVSMTKRL